jgi:hypothetical protein
MVKWATPGELLLSALAQMFLALWEEVRKLTLASRLECKQKQ